MISLSHRWWIVSAALALLFLALLIALPYPRMQPQPADGPADVDLPTKLGHVTEENFRRIREGMSRQEVDLLLGPEHRMVEGSNGPEARVNITEQGLAETTYDEEQGRERKRVVIAFEMHNFTVRAKEVPQEPEKPRNPGHVTKENYARIRRGMGREEVDMLLGADNVVGVVGSTNWSEIMYAELVEGPLAAVVRVTFEPRGGVKAYSWQDVEGFLHRPPPDQRN